MSVGRGGFSFIPGNHQEQVLMNTFTILYAEKPPFCWMVGCLQPIYYLWYSGM